MKKPVPCVSGNWWVTWLEMNTTAYICVWHDRLNTLELSQDFCAVWLVGFSPSPLQAGADE